MKVTLGCGHEGEIYDGEIPSNLEEDAIDYLLNFSLCSECYEKLENS